MVLGDITRTRKLAGNHDPAEVSDADITFYLTYGTSKVKSETSIDFEAAPFTSDPNLNTAVMAAEYIASSAIRDRYGDEGNISGEHFRRGKENIADITRNVEGTGVGGIGVAKGTYKTYPKNTSALIYRSLSPTSSYLGEDVEGPRA